MSDTTPPVQVPPRDGHGNLALIEKHITARAQTARVFDWTTELMTTVAFTRLDRRYNTELSIPYIVPPDMPPQTRMVLEAQDDRQRERTIYSTDDVRRMATYQSNPLLHLLCDYIDVSVRWTNSLSRNFPLEEEEEDSDKDKQPVVLPEPQGESDLREKVTQASEIVDNRIARLAALRQARDELVAKHVSHMDWWAHRGHPKVTLLRAAELWIEDINSGEVTRTCLPSGNEFVTIYSGLLWCVASLLQSIRRLGFGPSASVEVATLKFAAYFMRVIRELFVSVTTYIQHVEALRGGERPIQADAPAGDSSAEQTRYQFEYNTDLGDNFASAVVDNCSWFFNDIASLFSAETNRKIRDSKAPAMMLLIMVEELAGRIKPSSSKVAPPTAATTADVPPTSPSE